MKRFKTRKKGTKKFFKLVILTSFVSSFFLVFSYFVNPVLLVNYIRETHFNKGDVSFSSWFFNETFNSGRIKNELNNIKYIPDPKPLENKKEAIVYIYNTHQTEEYFADLLMEHDVIPSVMTASYILREKLNELGLESMVETNDIKAYLDERGLNYNNSYMVSKEFMAQAIVNYPTLNYFIDLHRDSISYESSTLVANNLSYAKVLFVIGIEHDNYRENENLASKISDEMNNLVPNISRGILEKGGSNNNGIYNQDFNSNVILIEIGSSYNTIMEVKNTIDVLAQSIKKVIVGA